MESEWRYNLIRAGWEDWSVSDFPEGNDRLTKLAILVTPEVWFGTTFYSIVEERSVLGSFLFLTTARLLDFVSFPGTILSVGFNVTFPGGRSVLPDHL